MSLVFFTCVAAGAAAIGWVSGRKARERHEMSGPARAAVPQSSPNPFSAFPCGLKDVLARTKDDELLISGGLRLSEGGSPIAAIFFGISAPGVHRVLVAFPDKSDILWLDLERSRRLPVLVERFGTELPEVEREMILAEYRGGAGHGGAVLRGAKFSIVAAGDVVSFSSLERYPGS
jgi:hypothetical protein